MKWTIDRMSFGKVEGSLNEYYVFNVSHNTNCCFLHDTCGKSIMVGDIFVLHLALTENNTECLNAIKIKGGVKECKFDFNTIDEMGEEMFNFFKNKIVEVIPITQLPQGTMNKYNGIIKGIVIGNAIDEFQ